MHYFTEVILKVLPPQGQIRVRILTYPLLLVTRRAQCSPTCSMHWQQGNIVPKERRTLVLGWWKKFSLYICLCAQSLQLCVTLWDPMDYSSPSSSVRGILQARILEWVVVPFSRIFPTQGSNPHLLHLLRWEAGSLPLAPPGKFHFMYKAQIYIQSIKDMKCICNIKISWGGNWGKNMSEKTAGGRRAIMRIKFEP